MTIKIQMIQAAKDSGAKLYEIYDENNEKIGNITGTDLEKFVLDKKKEIDSLYST